MAAEGLGPAIGPAVVLMGAAVIAVPLFRRLGLGSVLGYFAAGALVGPSVLGLFTDPDTILHFAELGVVMFLFIIGLELLPQKLWALRGQIFGLGLAQVSLAIALLSLAGVVVFTLPPVTAFIAGPGSCCLRPPSSCPPCRNAARSPAMRGRNPSRSCFSRIC